MFLVGRKRASLNATKRVRDLAPGNGAKGREGMMMLREMKNGPQKQRRQEARAQRRDLVERDPVFVLCSVFLRGALLQPASLQAHQHPQNTVTRADGCHERPLKAWWVTVLNRSYTVPFSPDAGVQGLKGTSGITNWLNGRHTTHPGVCEARHNSPNQPIAPLGRCQYYG